MQALSEQPESFASVSPEDRFKILQSAVEMHNLVYPDATPIQIINSEDLVQHFQNTQTQEGRQILLVKINNHYFTLDVLKNGEHMTCVVLDAANDGRCYAAMGAAEASGFSTYMATSLDAERDRNLQSDASSCGLFALDHCVQLSFENDPRAFHDHVVACSENEGFTWDNLPVNYLWNCQSNSFLMAYGNSHKAEMNKIMPNGMNAIQYITQGQAEEDGARYNNSINKHVLTHALQAHKMATIDRIYSKNDTLSEMEDTLDALRELGNVPSQTLQQLEEMHLQFAQSTEDAVQYQIKNAFDQLAVPLLPAQEESSRERMDRFRGAMQAGRVSTSASSAAVSSETKNQDAGQNATKRLS